MFYQVKYSTFQNIQLGLRSGSSFLLAIKEI